VVAIDPPTPSDTLLGPLSAVMAKEEARQLNEVLEQSSLEKLRARVAELESQQAQQAADLAQQK